MQLSCAQQLTTEQIKSRKIAEEVVKSIFGDNFKQKTIGVFSSGDEDFLILEKRGENTYYEIKAEYFKGSTNIIGDTLYNESRSLFIKIFDTSNYNKGFISFSSDLYKNGYDMSRGNFSYFVLYFEGERYGESRLSIFVIPTPFDAEIYYYFVESLLWSQYEN